MAYKWLNIAAARGNTSAIKMRDMTAEQMTAVQIAEAQKLSREWLPKKADKAVLNGSKIRQEDAKPAGTGTGFRVDEQGAILTNHHVIKDCVVVKVNGETVTLRSTDSHNDLALLQGSPSSGIAHFRAGRSVRVGEEIVVAGYPLRGVLGGGLNIGTGTVSALAGLGNDSRLLQISAPVNAGNSGGPLLDRTGRVVGIIVSKVNAVKSAKILGDVIQGANFATKASVARSFLDMNDVGYEVSTSKKTRLPADIAESAKDYTVLVKCWK